MRPVGHLIRVKKKDKKKDKKTTRQQDNKTKKDKNTKRQQDNKTKRQQDKKTTKLKKTKKSKIEFNIVMSGQFRTIAMFFLSCHTLGYFIISKRKKFGQHFHNCLRSG